MKYFMPLIFIVLVTLGAAGCAVTESAQPGDEAAQPASSGFEGLFDRIARDKIDNLRYLYCMDQDNDFLYVILMTKLRAYKDIETMDQSTLCTADFEI